MKKMILLFLMCIMITNIYSAEEKVKVAVSIYPIGDMVKQIAGDRAEVHIIVKPGESPHTFSPRPSDMKYLSKADIFFTIGLGLEYWSDKFVKSAGNKKLKSVELSSEIKDLIKEEHREEENGSIEEENEHGEYNPHIWFSPVRAVIIAERIKKELIEKDKKNAKKYEKNCEKFVKKLKNMDSDFKKRAAKFRKKEFVCFHPAYVYFEKDYGIKHILSIEEFPGKEPSSKYIKNVIDLIKKEKIEVIFAEPQFSMKVVNLISKETGVKIGILDPIGGIKGKEGYIELMNYNFDQIERILK